MTPHQRISLLESAVRLIPRCRIVWLEPLCVERTPDDRPALGQRADRAGGQHLHQDIARGRGLDGAGDHRTPDGVRRKLAQEPVLRPAADDVQRFDACPTSSSNVSSVRRYFSARLSKTMRATVPFSAGTGWPVRRQ